MLALDREEGIGQDCWIEIRPHRPVPSSAAPDLAHLGIEHVFQSRVLRLAGEVTTEQIAVLADPLVEETSSGWWGEGDCLDVFCRPGVTDAEGEVAVRALRLAGADVSGCATGTRHRFTQPVPPERRAAVERLLGNSLIHQFLWHDEEAPRHRTVSMPSAAELVPLRDAGDAELLDRSRLHHLALDPAEMRTVAGHYRSREREPTDVELQSIALTWSEHCSHKTFKATINFTHNGREEVIPGLLATYLVASTRDLARPWVLSAFVDNAGVIALDDAIDLAVKVETHNHPSALEPYGGAHTGLGGVIRDVLAVSAEPIANTDVLCFGPLDLPEEQVPAGVFHPRRTFREVVRGISGYGNNMGIPTVGGAVLFHPGYTANPLVYCGTLGIAPRGSHPREPHPGDLIVLLGGRTGRDGLHGATMSSETLDREAVAASAVQIGNPITEKLLRDVLPRLRDERLYSAITDCGAGGLCSAVGEMGEDLGVEVDLALVPLKYEGLQPWEVWLSEAQERMVLAVPDSSLARAQQICRDHDLEVSVIGRFTGDRILHLRHAERPVADLDMAFLHDGRPARVLSARWDEVAPARYEVGVVSDPGGDLLALLAHPTIASKEEVIRRYDHEVGAATIIKPLVGNAGPSDAALLRPLPGSTCGVAVAHGINPLYGALDPHAMAMLAADEALRNIVAIGGSLERTALLDNFCWGDVDDPAELGALVRATQGCRDAALAYRTPFISGKDSLRNTSAGGHSIPGTLLITAVGVLPDVHCTVTMDLKVAGSHLYLLGLTRDELGGSHYLEICSARGGVVPRVRPKESVAVMLAVTRAIEEGCVLACHDLSEGGLAVAAAEMVLAGNRGLEIDLERIPSESDATEALLFSESAGRFLVEVPEGQEEAFERIMVGVPCAAIGRVSDAGRFVVRKGEETVVDLPVTGLERAWKGTLAPDAPIGRGVLHTPGPGRRNAWDGEPAGSPSGVDRHGRMEEEGVYNTPLQDSVGEGGALVPAVLARPKALVLAAAGINCDPETVEACRLAGADASLVHVNQLLSGEVSIADVGMLVIPGGFSYGDHLGAGAMLATTLRYHLLDDLHAFVADGRPVLGICNGFQVLARLGLLGDISLIPNASGRFECRWVPLVVEPSACIFLRNLETCELPIAHGEGRLVTPNPEAVLANAPLRYLANPNGSTADIAGVCNDAGNVFGLMPHPERYVMPEQHPSRAAREPAGLTIFRNAVRYAEGL